MRIPEVLEAEEVVIEIGERCGDLSNFRGCYNFVVGGKRAFLQSVARRAKYEFFLWKVIAEDDVGFLPAEVVYQGEIGWPTAYRILNTKPKGEVQITPKTSIMVKIWDCKHTDCPKYQECYRE